MTSNITRQDLANARAANAEMEAAERNERDARSWARKAGIRVPADRGLLARFLSEWRDEQLAWVRWDGRVKRLTGAMDVYAAELEAARQEWPAPTQPTAIASEPEFEQPSLF